MLAPIDIHSYKYWLNFIGSDFVFGENTRMLAVPQEIVTDSRDTAEHTIGDLKIVVTLRIYTKQINITINISRVSEPTAFSEVSFLVDHAYFHKDKYPIIRKKFSYIYNLADKHEFVFERELPISDIPETSVCIIDEKFLTEALMLLVMEV